MRGISIFATLVIGTGLASASLAMAAEDPIANRQNIMKNHGAAMGILSKMEKGETAFDATAAMLALRTIYSGSLGFGELFPAGSEAGGETRAAPAIWEKAGEFAAVNAKLQADAAAAVASPPSSVEQLAAARGAVGNNCGGCHEVFRLKKQ